jgi:cytidine deaminase
MNNPWQSLTVSRDELLEAARQVLKQAHSPYSGVCVGAAILDSSGQVFVGCNVENASYGLTICGERMAVGQAVASGSRQWVAVAIATNRERCLPPCGACRQVLMEFAPELLVVSTGTQGKVEEWSLGELLPHAFSPSDLTE